MAVASDTPWYFAAVGFLLLLGTLFFAWSITPILWWFLAPEAQFLSRFWLGWVIAILVLSGASLYFREVSLLWQVPVQAAALALLVVGLEGFILHHAFRSPRPAAICAAYLAAGALLGLWMRNLQSHFLRRRRRPSNNRWSDRER
jgi:hypothetical protein